MTRQSLPFTQKAYQALAHAGRLAEQLRHAAITPEHILFGLLQMPDCHARLALEALHTDLNAMTRDLEDAVRTSPAASVAGAVPSNQSPSLANETKAVLTEAAHAAEQSGASAIGTFLLLLALLRTPRIPAGRILRAQNVTESALQLQAKLAGEAPSVEHIPEAPPLVIGGSRGKVSPIFVLIVIVTLLTGYLAYVGDLNSRFAVFLFVTSGWVVTLCLHEFGHAIAAYLGGDKSVANKGYLTLNPLKYTNGMTSIVLPVLIMMMGGIGLPGGAVYINTAALRSRGWRSLVSASGPLANVICAGLMLTPFAIGIASVEHHPLFWAGIGLLAYLQIHAIILNLLPMPGLDGFGIIAPFLPPNLAQAAYSFGGYVYFILFALLWSDNIVSRGIWDTIDFVSRTFKLDLSLVGLGFALFRFWVNR